MLLVCHDEAADARLVDVLGSNLAKGLRRPRSSMPWRVRADRRRCDIRHQSAPPPIVMVWPCARSL